MKPGYYWGRLKTLPFIVDVMPVAVTNEGKVRFIGNAIDWQLSDFEIGEEIQAPNQKGEKVNGQRP